MTLNEDCSREEIIRLIDSTLMQAEKNYRPFRAEEFVWRFGASVISRIMGAPFYGEIRRDCRDTCFGIDVEPDVNNPYMFKLYRDITMDEVKE